MARYRVQGPDGKIHVFEGPDGATPADVEAFAAATFSAMPPEQAAPKPAQPERTLMQRNMDATRDQLAGLVRGAGSIGATLLAPFDAAARAVGVQNDFIGRTDRREAMDAGLRDLVGADPTSMNYAAGKLGGEMLGTAGAGGALAKGATMVPGLATKAPALVEAIRTAGMSAKGAGMGTRIAGGAITGGVSAGMVDPGSAGTGALIGGAAPPVLTALGKAGRMVGSAAAGSRNMLRNPQARAGTELARALDVADSPQAAAALAAQLRAAPELVPGSRPTMAQALGTPQAGVLQRVVHDSPGGSAVAERLAAQNAARLQALEGVAPTAVGGFAEARQDLGEAVGRFATAEREMAAKANRAQYAAVDPAEEAGVLLPVAEMRAAAEKFGGAGAVGDNAMPRQIANEAAALSKPTGPAGPSMWGLGLPPTDQPASWGQVMRMRASLNEQWNKAKIAGDRQAAAALDAQKQALDSAIEGQLGPEMLARWQEANASRAAIGARFDNGPQGALFRRGADGQPQVQGGEVMAKFWGNRPGLADDVDSFRRLIDDNPDLLGRFRSMVTTQGAGATDAAGRLGAKFPRWVESMAPGLRRTFTPEEFGLIQRIAQDIQRAESAAAAGMARGSPTFQNAANALDIGLLKSPMLNRAASLVPLGQDGLQWLQNAARDSKARRLAGVVADSQAAADALDAAGIKAPSAAGRLLTDPALAALFYRAGPVAAATSGDR